VAAVTGLSAIRLLSEIHIEKKKEARHRMDAKTHHGSITLPRRIWQYLLETIWTVAAGAMAGSLGS
jgi:hypothetical protein